MTISPVFPWKPLTVMPFHWCQQNLFLKALSPSPAHRLDVGHPSWLPNPNLVFPFVFLRVACPMVQLSDLIPQPPWKEMWSCDRVAAKERSAGGFGKHFVLQCKEHMAEAVFPTCGFLVWEAVCWGATAAPVTKEIREVSPESEVPELLELQGLSRASKESGQ